MQWKNELKIELESWNLSQDSSKSWILENFQLKTKNRKKGKKSEVDECVRKIFRIREENFNR